MISYAYQASSRPALRCTNQPPNTSITSAHAMAWHMTTKPFERHTNYHGVKLTALSLLSDATLAACTWRRACALASDVSCLSSALSTSPRRISVRCAKKVSACRRGPGVRARRLVRSRIDSSGAGIGHVLGIIIVDLGEGVMC